MKVTIDDVVYVPAPPSCADAGPLEYRMFVADMGRNASLREYLHALLSTLWNEGEGFNGKRPFGNSGWEYDIYKFLVGAGAVCGSFDEEGYLEDFDKTAADKMMPGLIAAAMGVTK